MRSWLRRLGPYLGLGLGVGLVLALAYQEAVGPYGQTTTVDGSWEAWGGANAGQTFVAPFDGLYRVDVFVSLGGHPKTGSIVLHLRTSPEAADDLASDVVSVSTLSYGGWVTFEFTPVSDSGGKEYYCLLEAPTSPPGGTLSVLRSPTDRYSEGRYYRDGAPAEGDLAFALYTWPGAIGWLRGLSRLLAMGKPSLWGQPACYAALLVVYLVLLPFLIRRLFLPEPQDTASSTDRGDGT